MEDNNSREQLNELSGQLMDLFVSDLFTKNKVDIEKVKARITDDQRENLRQTVEQLKAQVEDFLESRTVLKVEESEGKTEGQAATNPLREAILQRKQMKRNNKNNTNR
ncbi:hypothetical protein QTL97_13175 [Sporosarcina thermotolerans]|uniref:Spore coat protein n=1 Tax=Sporosarcina thermotolerans TaxID=633404 RepID=A0AAW9A9N7_9BACL|nr:hypothetical protein [Sporosarcina thermotolerans]MDW0117892.1 hypothetical protein [Sporosarcina thermotolerans]WHT49305.1 hypothetical protein QNH10_06855 [Sporosarcina thermotolerans]